ncbi:type II toxin-antitoxin system VapC family toxin [Sinomonas sp. P47F7]|uniref:type II toxin-antitoxin system VapC family toxin n=1 Tax=Sinomonas sp. P47F7 TaxID=3410987 RepID=UPI003BF49CC7
MIVLDAGILIGLLSPTDAHHTAALNLLAPSSEPFVVHTLTLAEVLVGPAKSGREGAVRDDLADIGLETASLGPNEALLLARTRANHALKMPDACVLATAIHLQAPLATFDAKLAAAARGLGLLCTEGPWS